jgi:regulator of sigma E protease
MGLVHLCGKMLPAAALGLVMPETLRLILTVGFGLTLIILAHEWGHFILARAVGVRVEVFSILGIGPRLFGWRWGDTDYRFSLLPIGAFVKMAGESSEEERAGAPDEFLSKARWQRALILAAGPVMNLVCAVLLFFLIFWVFGLPEPAYLAKPPVLAGVLKDSPAAQTGLRAGDRLVQVNGAAVATWRDVADAAEKSGLHSDLNLFYARENQTLTATVKGSAKTTKFAELVGFPSAAVRIEELVPGLPAERAGLKPGDLVTAVNGRPMASVDQFYETVQQSDGHLLNLALRRDGQALSLSIQPYEDTLPDGRMAWKIGAYPGPAEVHYRRLPFVDAASLAAADSWNFTVKLVGGIWQLVTAHASLRELSGPVGIARISGQAARRGIPEFLSVLAIISLNLAIVNFLPIPILDGGHLLMLALEGVRRRDFSAASRERFLRVGMAFLLLLFVLVMYNDLRKLIPAKWLG